MTLLQLMYFRVMARVLHYTKASQVLRISQPSLSYSLAELENELNVKLFIKRGKQVSLSEYGEAFLEYTEKALDTLDDGVQKLKLMTDQVDRSVMLGYIHSVSFSLVPRLIEKYYTSIGTSKASFYFVQDSQNELNEGLRTGKLDIAFSAVAEPDIPHAPIEEQELFLVVPQNHPFVERESVSFRELDGEPFISLFRGTSLSHQLSAYFAERGIEQNIVMEARDCDAVTNYVSLGIGISIIPLVPALAHAGVPRVRFNDCECRRTIYISWRKDEKLNPAALSAKDFFLSHCPNG